VDFGKGTVFVLGAGFTRAVLPNSPLLVDDYDIEPLLGKYKAFPDASEVLKSEVREDGGTRRSMRPSASVFVSPMET
jgi:hypothetical protein